jgi:hypothetical protein
MSWFDDLVSVGKSVVGGAVNFFTGNSIGSNIAKTALLGYAVSKVNKSVNKSNTKPPPPVGLDKGVRLQVNPAANEKIPVVYGSATFGGIVSDAFLTADNKSMYFVLTLSERTGNLLSTGAPSAYVFNDIYLDDNRVVFKTDGITADYMIDREGNQDISIRDIVKVYCYAGNSNLPVAPEYYTNGSLLPAYSIMPNWTSAHTMDDLLFAIVRLDYVSDKGIRKLPTMQFTITNSLSLPGDVLADFMTNTRYGAGIAIEDIYSV